jgi:hypothetical protein
VRWEGNQCREAVDQKAILKPARMGLERQAYYTSIANHVMQLFAHIYIEHDHAPFGFSILAPLVRDPALEEDVIVGHGACDDGWWRGASKAHHTAPAAVLYWFPDLEGSLVELDSKLLVADPPCGSRRRSRPGVAAASPSSVATPAATTAAPTQAKDGGHDACMCIDKGEGKVKRACRVEGA